MTKVKSFQQGNVIKQVTVQLPTKGVCFRLTFKWAACTLVGGQFNFTPNADKVASKHSTYRTGTLAAEKRLGGDFSDLKDFLAYTKIDWDAARKYVNEWGAKFTDANKKVFKSVYVFDQSDDSIREYLQAHPNLAPAAVMVGFYGRRADGKSAWGHVVGFCSRGCGPTGNDPCFFDSNSGVYEFGANEDKGTAMMKEIRSTYTRDGRLIESFNTLVLKAK